MDFCPTSKNKNIRDDTKASSEIFKNKNMWGDIKGSVREIFKNTKKWRYVDKSRTIKICEVTQTSSPEDLRKYKYVWLIGSVRKIYKNRNMKGDSEVPENLRKYKMWDNTEIQSGNLREYKYVTRHGVSILKILEYKFGATGRAG